MLLVKIEFESSLTELLLVRMQLRLAMLGIFYAKMACHTHKQAYFLYVCLDP